MTEVALVKNSLCILIRRSPYGQIHAAEAMRHLNGALADGLQTSAILIDDGVYVARDGQETGSTGWTSLAPVLAESLTKGARVLVHAPSAQTRGLLKDERLVNGVELVSDDEVMRLLAASDAVMVY